MRARDMKKQKKINQKQQYTSKGKTLDVSFNDDGDCTIAIQFEGDSMFFEIPEELTEPLRLLFWDNYRRLHVWKTKAQKKAEKLMEQQVQSMEDIPNIENFILPDMDIVILPDIIEPSKRVL